jgi:hypothetical protein
MTKVRPSHPLTRSPGRPGRHHASRAPPSPPAGASSMPEWLSGLVGSFKAATPSQQAYTVVAGVAALLLLPRLLILAFVGLERLFVGLLLELEELIVLLTLKTLTAVSGGALPAPRPWRAGALPAPVLGAVP